MTTFPFRPLLLALCFVAGGLLARPVTPSEAQAVAAAWCRESGTLFGNGGTAVGLPEPIDSASGDRLGYSVALASGGSLVVSGDTEFEPVIASIPGGRYADLPAAHPLRTMVRDGLTRRFRLLAIGSGPRALSSPNRTAALESFAKGSAARWSGLLGETPRPLSVPFKSPPARLIASLPGWEDGTFSHWNQSEGNAYVNLSLEEGYSRYTPSHYVAGCVAIAGTAIIQSLGVGQGPGSNEVFACTIDGRGLKLSPFGRPYDWSLLPAEGWMPPPTLSAEAKELLGRVPYEVGISVNMAYGQAGSSATMDNLVWSLRFVFGLPGAKKFRFAETSETGKDYLLPIEADLRAGRPVGMTVDDGMEAHAVVANGFGRDAGGTAYTRVFMGWGGNGDAWFALPDIAGFSSVTEIIGSIDRTPGRYPVIGSLANGRGEPVAYHDLSVRFPSGETRMVKTDLNGNYCFLVNGLHDLSNGGDPYDEWVDVSVGSEPPVRVEIPASQRHGLKGPDLLLADGPSHPFTTDLEAARQEALATGRRLLVLFDRSRTEGGPALYHGLMAEPERLASFACAYADGTLVLQMKPAWSGQMVGVFDPAHCFPYREYESDLSGKGEWTAANGLLGETSDTSSLGPFLDRFIPRPQDHTASTPVPVPHRWLDDFNLVTNGDYESAASALGANNLTNWVNFTAGLDPTDSAARFLATVSVDGDGTRISWTPDLNETAETRLYKVWGTEELSDLRWHWPVRAGDRFYRVTVEMPNGRETSDEGGKLVPFLRQGVQLWANGPCWAEMNIGATRPWEAGYYFWWGDTTGYERLGDQWVASSGSPSGFSFDVAPTEGKDNDTLRAEGWIDSAGNLAPGHDAACAHWGGGWRMPTVEDVLTLAGNTTTEWITTNGVPGRLVKGKGAYSSASIFLPAAGCGSLGGLLHSALHCYYWSSSPTSGEPDNAWDLFSDSSSFFHGYSFRCNGMPVRPLRPSAE